MSSAPTAANPTATGTYATRNDAFSPPCRWSLSDALLLSTDDGPPRRIPFESVQHLRLRFAPTRIEPRRFRCDLILRSGETLTLFNRTYVGFAQFADSSAAYHDFVRTLVTHLAASGSPCVFVGGASHGAYLFNWICVGFTALILLGASAILMIVGLIPIVVVKLVLLALYAPAIARWLRRNRPRVFTAGNLPAELLPPLAAST